MAVFSIFQTKYIPLVASLIASFVWKWQKLLAEIWRTSVKIFGLENGEKNIQIINADICLLLYFLFINNARRGTYLRKSIYEKMGHIRKKYL